MFEPVHGSAPDIAGQGKANPLAAIWSVSQMLDFFGYENWGSKVLNAIEQVMVEKKYLTPDMSGTSKTNDVGDAVIEVLKRLA
ncbi:isocitrate/isopropylmalate family dehydrogenase [Clostridium sp. BNL1100]|uniref:isocitrate/isopropylmalate family dehydrogenase n=1 Tax=Clostridium sp. BNL1100 TaxID=755731 RepID=UPI00030D5ACB